MHRNTPQIDTEALSLPRGCRFRIWSRAELEVDDARIVLEGSHVGLMLELLRNRGTRVPSSLLWAAMLGDDRSEGGKTIEDVVANEIRHIRYAMSTKGILLSIDDSEPDKGFMLSDVCRVETAPSPVPQRRRTRSRKVQRPITQDAVAEIHTHKQPCHGDNSCNVPYTLPERLERRNGGGGNT